MDVRPGGRERGPIFAATRDLRTRPTDGSGARHVAQLWEGDGSMSGREGEGTEGVNAEVRGPDGQNALSPGSMDRNGAGSRAGPAPWALVTGASGGIGAAIVRSLARRGWNGVLVARTRDRLEGLAQELERDHGVATHVVVSDLSRQEAPGEVSEEVARQGIEVDALVNNAGFGDFGPYLDRDDGREQDMIQVNVSALTRLTRHFAAQMATRGRGRILNVASTAAFQPGPLMTVYYATKAYVLAFSEALRHELADTGVTVTTLCPGPTRSGFQSQAEMEGSRLLRLLPVSEAPSVAEFGVKAMLAGRGVAVPGLLNRLGVVSLRFVPRAWWPALVRKAQE